MHSFLIGLHVGEGAVGAAGKTEGEKVWASTKEYAEALRCSDRHVRNLCARGEVRHMRIGKLWRVWLEEGEPQREETATARDSREKTARESIAQR